jgi:hypothetical protein
MGFVNEELLMAQSTTRKVIPREARKPVKNDCCFELPSGLYKASAAGYLGFLAVMAIALMNPGLELPMVIFVLVIAFAFGAPLLLVRIRPEDAKQAMRVPTFMERGIDTASGHLSGGEASVQILLFPALIVFWGVVFAIIAALH